MQQTVLVSAAGGFIGKYVVDKLCGMGYAVTALIRNHRQMQSVYSPGCRYGYVGSGRMILINFKIDRQTRRKV